MLNQFLNAIKAQPALILAYLFMGFLVASLAWQFIKFIVFIIQNSGEGKKPKK